MHTDAPTRRTAGRLTREDQRRLGDILQRVYDDVVRQGVPDRFKALLDELEEPSDKGQVARAPRDEGNVEAGNKDDTTQSDSDRFMEAKGASDPGSKGRH
jgi:hypothetical protein